MAIYIDPNPHPLLRYTVKLMYVHPSVERVVCEIQYMSEDEFSMNFDDAIRRWKDLIVCGIENAEEKECSITEWGIEYISNDFNQNNIISENVISLLKNGEIIAPKYRDEEEKLLAIAYLKKLKTNYTKEDVARAILKVTRNPKYEYAQRVIAIWGVTLRPQYIESQLRSIINSDNINDQLRKLLKDNTDENLRLLKAKLELLIKDWNLLYEKNNHKRAILVYRFLNDCNLINRNNESLKSMMEIVYSYLSLPPCTYNKEIQLTEPSKKEYEAYYNKEKLNAVTKRKCKIYPSINAKWATFKAKTHLT